MGYFTDPSVHKLFFEMCPTFSDNSLNISKLHKPTVCTFLARTKYCPTKLNGMKSPIHKIQFVHIPILNAFHL